MPIAEAKALTHQKHAESSASGGASQTFHIEDYDPVADREGLEKLAAWAYQFSPLTGIDDREPPETLLLDLQYATDLQRDEDELVAEIHDAFKRLGLRVRMGVASTIGAAWAVAHFCQANVTVVPPEQQAEAIAGLPVAALRLNNTILSQLERLGLSQVGQLYGLPRAAMQSRFGDDLLRRLDQAMGRAAELIEIVQLPPDFRTDWLFEHPVEHRPTIDQVVGQLVERLCDMLNAHQRGALQVACHFTCQDRSTKQTQVGMFCPTADPGHIVKLLEMRLEHITLSAPVTKVEVVASAHQTFDDDQASMFDRQKRRHESAAVGSVMDRMAGRLGREAVVRCAFRADAQPERACQCLPVTGGNTNRRAARPARRQANRRRSKPVATKGASESSAANGFTQQLGPLDRPLHLFREPVAVTVRAAMRGGPICEFVWHERHEIAKLWGPSGSKPVGGVSGAFAVTTIVSKPSKEAAFGYFVA